MPFIQQFETFRILFSNTNVNKSLRIETLMVAPHWQDFSCGQVLWPFLFWEAEAEEATRPPSESRSFEFVLFTKLFGHFSYVFGQTDLILF